MIINATINEIITALDTALDFLLLLLNRSVDFTLGELGDDDNSYCFHSLFCCCTGVSTNYLSFEKLKQEFRYR